MDTSLEILSNITIFSKYARHIQSKQRRETWEEIVWRNIEMHTKKFPHLEADILDAYRYVLDKHVLTSMRSAQFAGPAIELNNARIYNCAYLPMSEIESFQEIMFLLLGGTGVGYSVQQHHVSQLPPLIGPSHKTKKYVIGDSIVGWADSVKALVNAYFKGKPMPRFDFSDIRPKGSLLVTAGGKAPGPAPLKKCLYTIQRVFDSAVEERGIGTSLKPIEVHDINCHIADAVLSGGIRRAACIALFSFKDKEMLECKFGNWWELNPQRTRANNSVVMVRSKANKKHFDWVWERVKASCSGEPGIYWTNDKDMGTNPCCEIALRPYQFCNLTTINGSDIDSQYELNQRARAASFIGTLQASYTDFHYLRDVWKETTEEESLIGVSITGIGSGKIETLNLKESASIVNERNIEVAKLIGIKPAARKTTIKPEGSGSLVVGSSSGIHAWYAPYYIRRMRFNKDESIYKYLKHAIPHLVEDEFFKPETQAVVSIPVKSPEGAIFRNEPAIDLLERTKRFHSDWIKTGHIEGINTNNVSVTVSVKNEEWDVVGEWMWDNRNNYNGISVLPFDGGTYKQAPFEEITEDQYEELSKYLRHIDLTKVKEELDNTNLKGEAACSGGQCEI